MTDDQRPVRPSVAELRQVTQPPEVVGRRSAEHWTGDLYMRRLSPYLTRVLLRTGISANGVTWLMVLTGWAAAAALLLPGLGGAVLAVLLAQLQMLWDCCDGEVARWRRTFSPAGIFLDRVGHYTTESFIPLALGVRAAGGFDGLSAHYWVDHAGGPAGGGHPAEQVPQRPGRTSRGRSPAWTASPTPRPYEHRAGRRRPARRVARFVPFHKLYHSVEMTLLVLVAAVVDVVRGGTGPRRCSWSPCSSSATLSLVGHLVAILSSDRMRSS